MKTIIFAVIIAAISLSGCITVNKTATKPLPDPKSGLNCSSWGDDWSSLSICEFNHVLKKVEGGDTSYLDNLALHYLVGSGVEKDEKKAFDLYLKAAEHGDVEAMVEVAKHYQRGEFVPQDNAKAFELYLKAANLGSEGGMYFVGQAYREGRGVIKDDAKAFQWIKKSTEGGGYYAGALFFFGDAYFYGNQVQQDYMTALYWYKKAKALYRATPDEKIADEKIAAVKAACDSKGTTKILGIAYICATRDELNNEIKIGGGVLIDKQKYRNAYNFDSSALLPSSNVLIVSYTFGGLPETEDRLASTNYLFMSKPGETKMGSVYQMVESKYGKPHKSKGNIASGVGRFEWLMQDGMQIIVSSKTNDGGVVSLSTIHPQRLDEFNKAGAKIDAAQIADKMEKQLKAF